MKVAKHLVSKKKKRYNDGEFDLDLSYIKPNIIAMAFPAEKFESVYRNNMEDVVRFLKVKHDENYKVYNLCSEKDYDPMKFENRVERFPFDDHNPPPFSMIDRFCSNLDNFLLENFKNTAVVHCKAGKGRTGVMICCYLIHSQRNWSFKEALDFYAAARTYNCKGVTIPSQLRTIFYYDFYLKWKEYYNKLYTSVPLFLHQVAFSSVPSLFSCFYFQVYSNSTLIYKSNLVNTKKFDKQVVFTLDQYLPIVDDIRFEFYHRDRLSKVFLFQFWINTFFVAEGHKNSSILLNELSIESMFQQQCFGVEPSCCSDFKLSTTSNLSISSKNYTFQNKPDSVDYESANTTQINYIIHKSGLDRANKDKNNKHFPSDFKVKVSIYDFTNGNIDCTKTNHSPNSRYNACRDLMKNTKLKTAISTDDLSESKHSELFSKNSKYKIAKSTLDLLDIDSTDDEE